MKRKISWILLAAFLVSLIAVPVLRGPGTAIAAPDAPDNDFLDRLYNVYMSDDPNLEYRLNKIEYLIPHYENIESKLGLPTNAFRSVEILKDDSPEDLAGNPINGVDSSLEGRPVYEIRHGDKGGTSVIIWSQMHGTESTGTRALMDIFEFLLAEKDNELLTTEDQAMARELRAKISELNIHFVPMINPDGANNWRRYTMQNMSGRHPYLFVSGSNSFPVSNPGQTDLNRDAWTMETREAKLLWRAFANFDWAEGESQPIFGFTLHDQSSTGVGGYGTPAPLTMLHPGANGAKYFNDTRYRATQIIQKIDEQIQTERPEMVSRYTDDWGTVYFGDSYVMMGTGMILIETGHTKLDPEKMTMRRTNFKAILRGLWEMAGDYNAIDPVDWAPPAEYEEKSHTASVIPKPPSRSAISDVLLRNVEAPNGTEWNLAINRQLNVIQYDKTPGSTTLDGAKEHRSLWYYSSAFSGQGAERPFNDNLTSNSCRANAGKKPVIPYQTFNNGLSNSRYNTNDGPLRYWGPVGYPTNLGMTMGPTWAAVPTSDTAAPVPGSNLQYGDSVMFGYEELECGSNDQDLKIVPAKVYPTTFADVNEISLETAWKILREGYCAVRVNSDLGENYYNLPLVGLVGATVQPPTINDAASSGQNNFILANKTTGEAKYAVVSGYLIDLSQPAAYPTWGVRAGGTSSSIATADAPAGIDAYEGHFRNVYVR